MSSLTHFPLEPGCEDYAFWIRLLLTLNKDWTPSSLIHLRHWNRTLPWMSLMLLHLFQSLLGFSTQLVPFLIILSCCLLLAVERVNCGTRLGLFMPLCLWLPRCWHLNWSITFLATLLPLDSGPLLHQITFLWILPVGKLISLFQIFRLVLVPLHMLLLTQSNSFLTYGYSSWYSFLTVQGWGGVIHVSEVCELLLRFHDILGKAVSKQVGNSVCMLAHLFNSVSRQHREVWASQFPFLHSLKNVIPPSEACLY